MNLENFQFEKKYNQRVLLKYCGNDEKVIIPDTYQGEKVTLIDIHAFNDYKENDTLKEVILPKYLKYIEFGAFYHCTKLNSIDLPDGLENINSQSFGLCENLKEIILPKSLKSVESRAFEKCTSLTKVVALNKDTEFSKLAFNECNAIQDIELSILKQLDNQTQINIIKNIINKFDDLNNQYQEDIISHIKKKPSLKKGLFLSEDTKVVSFLLDLNMKITIEAVEGYLNLAIKEEHTGITALWLEYKNKNFTKDVQEKYQTNKELLEIGLELPTLKQFKAKWRCSTEKGGLIVKSYKGNDTHEVIPEKLADGTRILEVEKVFTLSPYDPQTKTCSITHLTIEAPIKTLCCFQGNKQLVEINLPNTIEKINEHRTFELCESLTTINIPNKLETFSNSMFNKCKNLKEITIPNRAKDIGSHTFMNCRSIEKIELPSKIKIINHYLFYECINLKFISLPKNLEKIEKFAFYGCKSLTEINIPHLVEEIESKAFCNCINLGFALFHFTVKGAKLYESKPYIYLNKQWFTPTKPSSCQK